MPIEFKEGNSGYTLGVEEELSIVDATTGELVPKIEEIMARRADAGVGLRSSSAGVVASAGSGSTGSASNSSTG